MVVGLASLSLTLLAVDFIHLDSLPFLRRLSCINLILSVCGIVRVAPIPLVLDPLNLGNSLVVRSCARPSLCLFVMDHLMLGSLSSSRGFSCAGTLLLALGRTRLRLSLAASDFLAPGNLSSSKGLAHFDSPVLVLDHLHLDSSLPLRSSSRLRPASPVLDFVHPSSFLSLRHPAHVDPPLAVCSVVRLGASLFASDRLLMDSSLLLQSPS